MKRPIDVNDINEYPIDIGSGRLGLSVGVWHNGSFPNRIIHRTGVLDYRVPPYKARNKRQRFEFAQGLHHLTDAPLPECLTAVDAHDGDFWKAFGEIVVLVRSRIRRVALSMTDIKGAACCGQSDRIERASLWVHSLDEDTLVAVVDEDGHHPSPVMAWATRPEHAAPPPTAMHGEVLRGAFCGRGLRVVVEGCNRRWPRPAPTAALICAECGRGRPLGSPPRGWPSSRKRWYRWFADHGIRLDRFRTTATVYDGIAAFRASYMQQPED